jgi:hypothetical protein
MQTWPTPEEAALDTMPREITHVVETRRNPGGDEAYVLLAVEARPPGYYLEANLCERGPDGGWRPSASAGGGFTDRTLADLRAAPPPPGIEARGWIPDTA